MSKPKFSVCFFAINHAKVGLFQNRFFSWITIFKTQLLTPILMVFVKKMILSPKGAEPKNGLWEQGFAKNLRICNFVWWLIWPKGMRKSSELIKIWTLVNFEHPYCERPSYCKLIIKDAPPLTIICFWQVQLMSIIWPVVLSSYLSYVL